MIVNASERSSALGAHWVTGASTASSSNHPEAITFQVQWSSLRTSSNSNEAPTPASAAAHRARSDVRITIRSPCSAKFTGRIVGTCSPGTAIRPTPPSPNRRMQSCRLSTIKPRTCSTPPAAIKKRHLQHHRRQTRAAPHRAIGQRTQTGRLSSSERYRRSTRRDPATPIRQAGPRGSSRIRGRRPAAGGVPGEAQPQHLTQHWRRPHRDLPQLPGNTVMGDVRPDLWVVQRQHPLGDHPSRAPWRYRHGIDEGHHRSGIGRAFSGTTFGSVEASPNAVPGWTRSR